jgi:transcriptional regulator with XRE-family HTH domain
MTAISLLIPEIERIAKDRRWSIADLATRLGISPKSFYKLRAGDTSLSLDVLARIVREFEAYESVRRLTLAFLAREYHAQGRSGHGRKYVGNGPSALPAAIPYRDRWRITAWAAHVPRTSDIRRGLFLSAGNASLLAAAARHVAAQLQRHGVEPVSIPGNARLSASHAEAALHAPVLIVERIDHASDSVAAVLLRRGDALRALVATSAVERDRLPDPHLVRLLRASTHAIALDRHAHRPAPSRTTA